MRIDTKGYLVTGLSGQVADEYSDFIWLRIIQRNSIPIRGFAGFWKGSCLGIVGLN